MEVKTKTKTQTQKIAAELAKSLKGGDIVALYGDLGAGKTVFVQGIAKGLGIKKRILSPTFVFMRSYPFIKNKEHLEFTHLDLYRGQTTEDFSALGLEEIFSPQSIVVLEWAQRIKESLPKKRIDVYIKVENGQRRISIKRNK